MLGMKIEDSDKGRSPEIKELKPENVEFAKRLALAADRSDSIPRVNGGRFSHIKRQMELHGHSISRETVRKWFGGEARPRADKMIALAKVLKVDEAWLAVGASPSSLPAETKAMAVHNEGGVNLVMGIFALAGANCALPEPTEALADSVHFYVIMGGRQRKVFVAVGYVTGDTVRFNGPGNFDGVCTIGVVQTGLASFKLFEISPKVISENGRSRGGYVELRGTYRDSMVSLGTDQLEELTDLKNLGR